MHTRTIYRGFYCDTRHYNLHQYTLNGDTLKQTDAQTLFDNEHFALKMNKTILEMNNQIREMLK